MPNQPPNGKKLPRPPQGSIPMRPPRPTGAGDIYHRQQEPDQAYWDTEEKGEWLPSTGLFSPSYPPSVTRKELEQTLGLQMTMACQYLIQLMFQQFQCNTLCVQQPTQTRDAPPASAKPCEANSGCGGVVIPPGAIAAPVTVATITMPERTAGIFWYVANELSSPSLCCEVQWAIKVADSPYSTSYQSFDWSIGTMLAPGILGAPIIAQPQQTVSLQIVSGNLSAGVSAFGLIRGFCYPLRDNLPFDGTWLPLHERY